MEFPCRAVEESFLTTAPMRFVNEVILDAPPEGVFRMFEDGDSWSKWIKGLKRVEWTSPKPFGVGTTRTVTLDVMSVKEYFFIWEQNKRFTFYFTSTSMPFVKALCEDYLLEPIGEGKTKFTYTVACEPSLPLKLSGPIGKYALRKLFKDATQALQGLLQR
ncbi:MAG: SRPBCC family protein [Pseudomonadales bacterium]|nr:SRPBCC family protein [Pseudomonadales bacterium]